MTNDDRIDSTNDPEQGDEDADLQIKQMRSVWLSMRDDDQEPSDRGMAALMAAAREQAEAMKPKRSWWAVLLEQLRRPPVLAMATAVVLIGGAVVISQRKDEMKTRSETADQDYAADNSSATPTPAPATLPPVEEPAKVEAPGAEMGLGEAGSAAPSAPPDDIVTQRQRPTVRPKPPGRVPGPTVHKEVLDQLSMTPEPPPADPKNEAKKEDSKSPLEIATGDEDMQSKGGVTTESTSVGSSPTPPTKPVTRKPLPAIEGEDRAANNPSVAQLIKQCEAAAAKNDCAAVRTIAAKIARQDPQSYKNRVMKNQSVARCLEPPAPMEAAPVQAD